MSERPTLMSHEERQRLIHAPVSFFTRYHSNIYWGGAVIENRPMPHRQRTPQDQDDDVNDERIDDDEY